MTRSPCFDSRSSKFGMEEFQALTGQDYDNSKTSRARSGYRLNVAAGVAIALVSIIAIVYLSLRYGKQGQSMNPKAVVELDKPGALVPPLPYSYSTFKSWFQAHSWESASFGMTPAWGWFGVDEALRGAKKAWFEGKDMAFVADVAKRINRFLFMRSIMTSGDDTSQASMAMHLLILKLLQADLTSKTPIRTLDVGAGTGWLLEAFRLINDNQQSTFQGLDIKGIELARHILANPAAFNGPTSAPQPSMFQADALKEDFGLDSAEREQRLPEHKFDIINVGFALPSEQSAAFQRITDLLADNGSLTVPICTETPQKGYCKGDFRLYRRHHTGSDGDKIVKETGGYDIVFIVPT